MLRRPTMKKLAAFTLLFATYSCTDLLAADAKKPPAEAKKDDKDPLAKFDEDKLVDIGFCFEKFCAAVSAKDVRTVAAFVDDMPKGLKQLDLTKEADKAQFLRFFAKFDGAQLVSSHRMPAGGIGEVKYTNKAGQEQS